MIQVALFSIYIRTRTGEHSLMMCRLRYVCAAVVLKLDCISSISDFSFPQVAKASKDPNEDRNTYFRDVQAQMCAKLWAAEYNSQDVPKRIDFVPAYVFELVDRPGRPLVGMCCPHLACASRSQDLCRHVCPLETPPCALVSACQ